MSGIVYLAEDVTMASIEANRETLELRDPLFVGDVVSVLDVGHALHEIMEKTEMNASSVYTVKNVLTHEVKTHVLRWQLIGCALDYITRLSPLWLHRWREQTTAKRLIVRASSSDVENVRDDALCALWDCVSLRSIEVRSVGHARDVVCGITRRNAVLLTRPLTWKTPWKRFVVGERVRVTGSAAIWRVVLVVGQVAQVRLEELHDGEGCKHSQIPLQEVSFDDMTVAGPCSAAWHVVDLARARGMHSALIQAMSGTVESARTRGIVESFFKQ